MKIQYKQSSKDSRFLEPVGDGNINVLDMSWTISPKSSRIEVPYAHLVEYQQTTGQLIASLLYYARVAARIVNNGVGTVIQPDKNPYEVYKYKYFAEPTGFSYRFPYFSPNKFGRSNSFGYDQGENPFSNVTSLGRNMLQYPGFKGASEGLFEGIGKVSTLAGLAMGAANTMLPGKIEFETPSSWSGSNREEYSLTFDLFNTGNPEDVENNRNLCHLLSYQNSPSRRNFAITDPPVIYSLYIPDTVHFPACWMSSLQINNLGNTRAIELGQNRVTRIIPEAYRITMSFTSLLMPSRNILDALDKGNVVEAISELPQNTISAFKTLVSTNATQDQKLDAARQLDEIVGITPYDPNSFTRNTIEN